MSLRLIRKLLTLAALAATVGACAGPAGPAGNSCTLRSDDAGGGATITCADGTTVRLTNGANGANGANGSNGANGADGMPCTVSVGDAGARVIRCADGTTVTVNDGQSASCTVSTDLDSGVRTIRCSDGTVTTLRNGTPGTDGLGVRVAQRHGLAHILSTGEYANGAKVLARAAITSATADPAGVVTVNFTVATQGGAPITDVPAISANISKLVPAGTTEASNHWMPYIWATETVPATGTFPNPAGTTALQATRETNGTLTNNRDGSYRYVFRTNLTSARMGTTPITYERNRTHRIVVMMGGHSGATADAYLDFVPDGTAVTERRNIIQTSNCHACHNENEFRGHGGDRLSIEACTSCHVTGARDANSGNSLALDEMIHKIHAGGELPSVRGADGIRYDNPATPANEAADNGSYAIYGYRGTRASWEHAEFPSVLANCTKCHQGSGAQVDNWMNNPSRNACGSCHDNVNFATGINHVGGMQTNDATCRTCHNASGPQGLIQSPVSTMHDWTNRDVRNKPEFNATVTVSTPANGTFFVRGESPVVTIVLRDAITGNLIDHTTVAEDPTAEGCPAPSATNPRGGPCPTRDGLFRTASLFVAGPRARRMPVLTTAARSQLFSGTAGPFDLSAAGGSLIVQFDQGMGVHTVNSTGGDVLAVGTVTVPVSSGTFVSAAAATSAEVVTWLNRNTAFAARGIAWVESNGRVGIRSRNLGTVFSIQLQASTVATSVFAGDLLAHMPTGSTPSNNVTRRIVAANQDPRVTYTAGAIRYQLDPVDDLTPGTYVASIEINDRGNLSSSDYQTPSVARVNFQVGQATESRAPAGNCGSCHQGPDGRGFVLDFVRHYKVFNNTAVDQCGACHDYQPQTAVGAAWTGAGPISRRVHAVHAASSELNFPLSTVGYSNGDPVPGRNWNLPFPQDLRTCESCHPAATTSGTWQTMAARLPCGGCHDSDAATSHMRLQTYDPTPATPWSGDEVESCTVCH